MERRQQRRGFARQFPAAVWRAPRSYDAVRREVHLLTRQTQPCARENPGLDRDQDFSFQILCSLQTFYPATPTWSRFRLSTVSPFSKSATRSSTCSTPIDRRIICSVTPIFFSSSGSIR